MSNYRKATYGVPRTTERKSPRRTIIKISNTYIKFSPCYLYLLFGFSFLIVLLELSKQPSNLKSVYCMLFYAHIVIFQRTVRRFNSSYFLNRMGNILCRVLR